MPTPEQMLLIAAGHYLQGRATVIDGRIEVTPEEYGFDRSDRANRQGVRVNLSVAVRDLDPSVRVALIPPQPNPFTSSPPEVPVHDVFCNASPTSPRTPGMRGCSCLPIPNRVLLNAGAVEVLPPPRITRQQALETLGIGLTSRPTHLVAYYEDGSALQLSLAGDLHTLEVSTARLPGRPGGPPPVEPTRPPPPPPPAPVPQQKESADDSVARFSLLELD